MATYIIFTGSVDGTITAAALSSLLLSKGIESVPLATQAFTVMSTLSSIEDGSDIYLVDVAVDNKNPETTTFPFIGELRNKGCKILGIIDEHDAEAWLNALGTFEGLEYTPRSQNASDYKSSGSVLRDQLKDPVDPYVLSLCISAGGADRGQFTGTAAWVNKAIKADIRDQQMRENIVRHLATGNVTPDAKMQERIAKYELLESNCTVGLLRAIDYGTHVEVYTRDLELDFTSFVFELYAKFPEHSLFGIHGKAWNNETKQMVNVFSVCTPGDVDVKALLEGVPGFGFEKKWNVLEDSYEAASDILSNLRIFPL